MKSLMVVVGAMVLACAASADAQPRGLKGSTGRAVFVIDANRQEWQGRLLKVSVDALEVESDAGIRVFNLGDIRRVDADGDDVWDGALKGALFGLALGAIAGQAAGAEAIPAAALSYGLVGLVIDGACRSRHPVYHGPATPRVEQPAASAAAALRVGMRVRW